MVRSFKLELISKATAASGYTAPQSEETTISVDSLAQLLEAASSLDLQPSWEHLISQILQQAKVMPPGIFQLLLVPLLRQLLPAALAILPRDERSCLRAFYSTTLNLYITRFVGTQAASEPNWVRQGVGCSCRDCWNLNLFLTSATERVARFPMNSQRRAHLHQHLNYTDCKHETERSGYPETLVVTKHNRQASAYGTWTQRCHQAHKELLAFDLDGLRRLFEPNPSEVDDLLELRSVITDPT